MRSFFAVTAALVIGGVVGTARADLTSPRVGWRAELNGNFHGVGGTVTIVDDDTVQVDSFTYDGGGISVYFYLGESDSTASFVSGLPIGPQLVGTAYDGSQPPLLIDLPVGETLEGWHAISVWCVTARANFGSGSFARLPGDFNDDGQVDAADYTVWRDGLGSTFDPIDYDAWKENFGTSWSGTGASGGNSQMPFPLAIVPEPSAKSLLVIAVATIGWIGFSPTGKRAGFPG